MIEFKLFGMRVTIKFLFVAVVTMFLLTDRSGLAITALLACMIHELGHIIMFVLVGYRPKALAFELTGIRITKPTVMLSYGKELLVQIAGSGVNLLIFAMLSGTVGIITNVSVCAVTHLVVGVFNLLPIKSFDGGKILELFLMRVMSIRGVQIVCTLVDMGCILLLLGCGVYGFFFMGGSFTLLLLSIFLLISAVMRI